MSGGGGGDSPLWKYMFAGGTAVCGLSVRVEDPQGDGNNDDTAMNGLALHCCTL